MDTLMAALLDLLRELEALGLPLVVGGGLGLHLKREEIRQSGQRTLLKELPDARSTNDIDMFLRAEILADLDRTKGVAGVIAKLEYEPVDAAKYLQWKKSVRVAGNDLEVKIDILVGPIGAHRSKLKVSPPRVRPKGDIKFHAHMVEEAIHVEEHQARLPVAGKTSNGEEYSGTVYVPDALPYLLMKLHAFKDRKDDGEKDFGRHHAMDCYTIVAMMTEEEFERAKAVLREERETAHVKKAQSIVSEDFATPTSAGTLRLREHKSFRPELQTEEFISILKELFAVPDVR